MTSGFLDARMVAVVWTPTADGRRIIAVRKADGREQQTYGERVAFIDADENTAADHEDTPDMSEVDPSFVTWTVGDRAVGEAEGRAAMAEALASRRGRVEVPVADRAAGPDWRDRMAEALRKAVGL